MLCANEPFQRGCEADICGTYLGETPQREMLGKKNPAASADNILAADLEKLSLREREKVYEDVHGVSDVVQETPELITSCLEQLDREINLITKKDAYEQAKVQSFSVVTDRQFRLAFLRFTSFNPKTAAFHLVHFFRIKREMFGAAKLGMFGAEKLGKSRITLEDLGEEAMRVLELGSMQVLPYRDSKGRVVVVSTASFMEPAMDACDDPVPSMTKAIYYLISTLYEDEETQKKGVVVVANGSGLSERHEKHHRALSSRLLAIAEHFPVRLACLHYCYNSSRTFSSMLLSVLASAAKSIVRVRVRIHNGSHTECLYNLMPFGIPVDEYPFTSKGSVNLENHGKWMEQRRKKEAYLSKYPPIEGAVVLPSNYDVLWGRGKLILRHPGNHLLHELVDAYFDQYNQLSKTGRTNLADQIVAVVHGFSGRFMKMDNESGMWVEVSEQDAREKVTHRFRHSRERSVKGGSMVYSGTGGGGKRLRMMLGS